MTRDQIMQIIKEKNVNFFRLQFVDLKAFHQIWHDIFRLNGLANDFNGLVDVEPDLTQALEEVQPVALELEVVGGAAAAACGAEPRRDGGGA